MKNYIFSIDVSGKDWDNFVISHPSGNIFQSMALFQTYQDTKNYTPVKIAAIDPVSEEIQGVMMGVVIREMNGFLGDFSARSIVQGGPLVKTNSEMSVITQLIAKYDSLVSHSALYNEIRNMYDTRELRNHICHYTYIDHLNFEINLNQPVDDLWQQIHKSRRKNVTRAEKAGLAIEEIQNPDKIPIFYHLLQQTYRNVKIPLADISLFKSSFQYLYPKKMVKFFLACLDNEFIGARAVLTYKNRIYDWYAGAALDALSYFPNEFLIWHILKWGIEHNYTVFDFGGAGRPDKPYGPREFKRRFGGELVNYGRYFRQYSKVKMSIADMGFKVYRTLFY